jgi:hypothetical protein
MAFVAGTGILAGGLALRPAFAVGGSAGSGLFNASVHCNSGSPCQTYTNKNGVGVEGITNGSSPFTSGVIGSSPQNGNGVSGFGSAGSGVNGVSSTGTGVSGSSSSSWGVYGYSNGGVGVQGQSVNSIGVEAFSSGPWPGLQSASSSGIAVSAISESNSAAVSASGGTGDAIDATTDGGVALYANNINGNGSDIRGTYIGIIGRAPAGTGTFPIALTDQNGANLFFVNGNGDTFYHGSLSQFAKTRRGNVAIAYASKTTSPTVEDNGTATLVGGVANVQLDTAFANTIDMRRAYQVMLTPDGDTKGLYIASKSPTGFVVREVQGGHASISFDYHIYAPALGEAGKRMTEMTPAQAAALMPRVQAFTRPVPKLDMKRRTH